MKQSSTKSPSLCRITDDDDDALMRVISVCFSNVHSFLWLNHLISWIMTDKKSVVSTPACQISAVGGLMSPWWREHRWHWGRANEEHSVDARVTADQAEWDGSPHWKRWDGETIWTNIPTPWPRAEQTLARTLDTGDKLAPGQPQTLWNCGGTGGDGDSFPMCLWCCCVMPSVSHSWLI